MKFAQTTAIRKFAQTAEIPTALRWKGPLATPARRLFAREQYCAISNTNNVTMKANGGVQIVHKGALYIYIYIYTFLYNIYIYSYIYILFKKKNKCLKKANKKLGDARNYRKEISPNVVWFQ